MFLKSKNGAFTKDNRRINVKLTIIYLLLIVLFAALIIFL
jgi:hypothetical protein